jgi:hypothetical protein
MDQLRSFVALALLTAMAGCSNAGALVVKNSSHDTLTRVTLTIAPSHSRDLTQTVELLAPGDTATRSYPIADEYSLYVEALQSTGRVIKFHYGYVIDNWRNPTHMIRILDDEIWVDDEHGNV